MLSKKQRILQIQRDKGAAKLVNEVWVSHIMQGVDGKWSVKVSYTVTTNRIETQWSSDSGSLLVAAREAFKKAKHKQYMAQAYHRQRKYPWFEFDEGESLEDVVEHGGHVLRLNRVGRWVCDVCRQGFDGSAPSAGCPECPVYPGLWDDAFKSAEKELGYVQLTKRQMGDAGFSTGKTKLPAPVAAFYYSKSDSGYLLAYNPAEGVAKAPLSKAQKKALEKAHRSQWVCERCEGKLENHERGQTYCDKCAAAKWAREILNSDDVAIWDSETTGLDSYRDEMLEIAVLSAEGHVLLDLRLKPPQQHFDNGWGGAMGVHGIRPEDVEGERTFERMYPEIRRVLQGRRWVIYKRTYDAEMLDEMCRRRGLPLIDEGGKRGGCAMEMYAQFVGVKRAKRDRRGNYRGWSYGWQKLPGGDHSALGDCRAVLKLLHEMARWWDCRGQVEGEVGVSDAY